MDTQKSPPIDSLIPYDEMTDEQKRSYDVANAAIEQVLWENAIHKQIETTNLKNGRYSACDVGTHTIYPIEKTARVNDIRLIEDDDGFYVDVDGMRTDCIQARMNFPDYFTNLYGKYCG